MGTYKGYVRNTSKPDGTIAEAYVVDEALTFFSRYIRDMDTHNVDPSSLVRNDVMPIHYPDRLFVDLNIESPNIIFDRDEEFEDEDESDEIDIDSDESHLDDQDVCRAIDAQFAKACRNSNTARATSSYQNLCLKFSSGDLSSHIRKRKIYCGTTRFLLLGKEVVAYNKGYNFNIVACKLQSFLEHFSTFPNCFLVGGPADFFVNELSLQKLKVESVLLHCFSQIKVLQGMELRMTTSTRLKSCLYSFTSLSEPMYRTRVVCHAAWDVLDTVFPVGQYPRHLISLFFRLLYPWYWPSSCWNFVISCIKVILFSVFELIISNWEKLIRPKRF
ncbi:hypothetical protein UlMin_039839 [Ulmus minor]